MLASLLTALLAASPAGNAGGPIAIVVARENPGSEAHALAVVQRLASRLEGSASVLDDAQVSQRLSQLGEPAAPLCQGRPVCLARLADNVGARAIVAVEAAELHGTVAVLVEGIGVDASRLCSREFVGKADGTEEHDAELASFAAELLRALAVRQPIEERQAPKAVVEPEPMPAPGATARAESGSDSRRVLGLTLDGAGLALLAGGVGFGLLAKGAYDDANAIAGAGDPSRAGELDEAKQRVKSRMLVADLLYGAGAIALAGGLYFTFSTPTGPIAVAPAAVDAGPGLTVCGGF